MANPFAKEVPTSSDPNNPGPRVKATALMSFSWMPAFLMACDTTGMMFCWCALEASSGTTPPKASCTFWLAIMLVSTTPSFNMAADVSSHDDSIPKIIILMGMK